NRYNIYIAYSSMVRLAPPLFLKFIETHSPAIYNLPVIESSDRRLRDTEIFFTSLDKERTEYVNENETLDFIN
ncbi:MAG: hypothetical protein MUO88_14650, partial [Desulfobacterales bacterium]|nr:hypothetical protein [Desulfobacterales bacterium]